MKIIKKYFILFTDNDKIEFTDESKNLTTKMPKKIRSYPEA